MSEQLSDGLLEARLRAALADLQPVNGAPARLRARVDDIPNAASTSSRWLRSLFLAGTAAAGMGLIALLAAGRLQLAMPLPGPGAGNAPDPTFSPSIEGPGIWTSVVPQLPIVFVALAAIVGAAGARWVLRARDLRGSMFLRAVLAVGACVAIAAPGFEPGFEPGSSYGPVLGLDVRASAPAGTDGPDAWYETAEPGGPVALMVSIRNPGPLAIRFEGIVESETADNPIAFRWTAVWLPRDANVYPNTTDRWQSFTPTVIEPGSEIQVNLVGRAGSCAFGPGFTLATPPGAMASRSRSIQVAYSVFGLTQTADVELPMQIVEPYAEHCPP